MKKPQSDKLVLTSLWVERESYDRLKKIAQNADTTAAQLIRNFINFTAGQPTPVPAQKGRRAGVLGE